MIVSWMMMMTMMLAVLLAAADTAGGAGGAAGSAAGGDGWLGFLWQRCNEGTDSCVSDKDLVQCK
jgi:hypothetical protein